MSLFETLKAFDGRRVLVTGHTGFKGAWMSFLLKEAGAHVSGFALEEPGAPAAYTGLGVRDILEREEIGDLGDRGRFEKFYAAAVPDLVIHMAAQPLVRLSYDQPLETLQTNVMGTAYVLDAVRKQKAHTPTLVITTDKCYENRERDYSYSEEDHLGGFDVYSASKAGAEIVAGSYRRAFSLPVATARAGNVIGGGDFADDRIIPDCVRALSKGRTPVLRNPGSVRPWQHVLEPLAGYLELGRRLLDPQLRAQANGAWNFGPERGDAVTVEVLVEHFLKAWGEGHWEPAGEAGPHEAKLLMLDSGKAKKQLNWQPRWSVAQAASATAQWYKEFLRLGQKPGSMAALTLRQAQNYSEGRHD